MEATWPARSRVLSISDGRDIDRGMARTQTSGSLKNSQQKLAADYGGLLPTFINTITPGNQCYIKLSFCNLVRAQST